jgi:hypothetical protein
VVDTPIKLRDPSSVLGFAEHMIRDYSSNSRAVREQREENVYLYLKGEGLEARFWCDFHRDFYQYVIRNPKLASKNMAPIVPMRYIVSVRNLVPTLTSNKRQGLSLNGRC